MIKHFKHQFFILFIVLSTQVLYAQKGEKDKEKDKYVPGKTFEINKLKQDLKVLKTCLKEVHPGLYWYMTPKNFEAIIDSTSQMITKKMTSVEFYKLLAPIIAKINCGHTRLYNAYAHRKYLIRNDRFFPLKLFIEKDKAFVLKNYDGKKIEAGLEVVSINGKSTKEILEKLYQSQYSDGYIKSFQRHKIQNRFSWLYKTLIDDSEDFKIVLRGKKKQDTTILLNGVKYYLLPIKEESNKKAVDFRLDKKRKLAQLTLKSFSADDYKSQKLKFSKFLKKNFRKMRYKKVKNLILDLRGNGGGEIINGFHLFSYLTNQNFKYYSFKQVTGYPNYTYGEYMYFAKPYLKKANINKSDTGYYLKPIQSTLIEQKPQKKRFKGNVYVLINGMSFSATAQLSSMLRNNNRITFVGEESGGTYNGCTAGKLCYLVLPNTKVRVFIPQIKYVMSSYDKAKKGRGIMPQHMIKPTVEDVISKKDVEMNYVLRLIEKQTK